MRPRLFFEPSAMRTTWLTTRPSKNTLALATTVTFANSLGCGMVAILTCARSGRQPPGALPAMSELLSWIATFAVGFAATFAFVTTGGVGMITIPALIFLGLSPQAAIATDIFALLGGRIGGLLGLLRGEKVDVALGLRLGAATSVGAVAGAFALLSLPAQIARQLIGAVLLVLLVVLLLRPRVGVEAGQPVSATRTWLGTLLFVPIGVYSTLIGAGFLNLGSAVLLVVL